MSTAPELAPWQGTLDGLLIGPGTPYDVAAISGLESLEGVRDSDEPLPTGDGIFIGEDYLSERKVTIDLEVTATDQVGYAAALDALRWATRPKRDVELWFLLPTWSTPRRCIVRVRRRHLPTDLEYELGLASAAVQLVAPDPVLYGPNPVELSTGFAAPAGGLQYPLYTSGSERVVRINHATSPIPGSAAAYPYERGVSEQATVTLVTGAADGPVAGVTSYLRAHVTAAKSSGYSGFYAYTSAPAPVTPGSSWVAAVFMRCSHALQTRLVTSGRSQGAQQGSFATGDSVNLPAGTWVRVPGFLTADAVADGVGWWASLPPEAVVPAGGSLDVTAVLVEAGTTLQSYFDGSTPDTAAVDYAWVGPAGASASIATTTGAAVGVGYLDYGPAGTTGRLVVSNPGDAPVWPVYEIDGPVGAEGFELGRTDTGARVRFSGAVPAGSTLRLDSGDGSAIIDGHADRGGALTWRDWWPIGPRESVEIAFLRLGAPSAARLRVFSPPGWW